MRNYRIKEKDGGYLVQVYLKILGIKFWYAYSFRNLKRLGSCSDNWIYKNPVIWNSVEEAKRMAEIWLPLKTFTYKGYTIKHACYHPFWDTIGYYIDERTTYHSHINIYSTYLYRLEEIHNMIDKWEKEEQINSKRKIVYEN